MKGTAAHIAAQHDLLALPTYFRVRMAAVGKGVRAMDDYAGAILPGPPSRNAHLWDRE